MTFPTKMEDKKIKVDLNVTNLKDVLQYCKPKEQLVLIKKFGIDWWKEISLQEIGKQYWLTRERIRQIESQWLSRFRRLIVWNEKYLKILEDAKKILNSVGWFLQEEQLIAKLLNRGHKLKPQEIKLILVSDFDIYYLKRNKLFKNSFYIDPLYETLLNKIAEFTISYFVNKQKAENLYNFIEILKQKFKDTAEKIKFLSENGFYMNLLPAIRKIKILDWKIGLDTFLEVNPKTIKQKLIYILKKYKKPLHYEELTSKILEWFPDKPVKVSTVHNELVKNKDVFVNMWLWLYWLKEWWFEWGTVKEIVYKILKKAWRPMKIKEIVKEALKQKMVSPNTIVMILQKNPEFERVEKWVYKLTE